MKICAIICEYNPFHNGHLYQLQKAKELDADAILCIMSGNFVQRGEAAVMDKYTRAKHAVMAGADIVVELPTVFATSNAELFAKGGIKLLSSIPSVSTLCFGAENADKNVFLTAAQLLQNEPQEISQALKTHMANGMSYAKARALAWSNKIPQEFLSSPNNILGIEYTKAIQAYNAGVDIAPILRVGGGYSETDLKTDRSSASAIRNAIKENANIDGNTPDFVKKDLPKVLDSRLDSLEKYAILSRNAVDIAKVSDCTEGLENAFKKAAALPLPLAESLTSSRYTASRIRRIALQNLLNIEEILIRDSLQTPLYLRVLAGKKARKDLLSAISESSFPVLTRAHDEDVLEGTAKRCFEIDVYAEKVYALLYPCPTTKNIFI